MKLKNIILIAIITTSLFSCNKPVQKLNLNIASYNIRYDNEHDGLDAWKHRKEMVKSLIQFHDFDIFGTQEGLKNQLEDIAELESYSYFGKGRDDGKDAGEHSVIFYKTDIFELLDSGDFWFSETPDKPSKGWDATCCNRICTWGKFQHKESSKEFFVFNSHFDHEGEEARRNSSLLLLQKIEEIAKNKSVFCIGDFNAFPSDEPMKIMYKKDVLSDSYKISKAKPYGTFATFNDFKIEHNKEERIDYIWVSKDITVNKYGTLNEIQHGHFPSDHYPIMINVSF